MSLFEPHQISSSTYVTDRLRSAELRVQIEPDLIDFPDRNPVLAFAQVVQRIQMAEQTAFDWQVQNEAEDLA